MRGQSLDEFLHRLAQPTPVPGGGSAAALAGAVSAALLSMVCGVTARHSPEIAELAEIAQEANDLRGRLVALITEDALAFDALQSARRTTQDRRHPAVQEALRGATATPLDLARSAQRILALCATIAGRARVSALADLGVAAALADAALDGAALTVRANLSGLEDPGFRLTSANVLDELTKEAAEGRRRVSEAIRARTGVAWRERQP